MQKGENDLYAKGISVFSFLQRKTPVEIFARHCHFSKVSAHKSRPPYFSKEKCFYNLLNTLSKETNCRLTFFLDTFYPMEEKHYLFSQDKYPIVEVSEGKEASSFLQMLDYVLKKKLSPETIIYFVEDDYIHREGWVSMLREAFTLQEADYVTLYDHKDKYFFPDYQDLHSKIFPTKSCHWRVTPSTTNTYAMRLRTLIRDEEIHRAFSQGKSITEDHAKFQALSKRGSLLLSPMPGFSTHVETEFLSPCVDWEKVLEDSLSSFPKIGG